MSKGKKLNSSRAVEEQKGGEEIGLDAPLTRDVKPRRVRPCNQIIARICKDFPPVLPTSSDGPYQSLLRSYQFSV